MERPELHQLNDHIKNVIRDAKLSAPSARPGIIIGYNPTRNTATVIMTDPISDTIGDILKDVPCPVYSGVQTVSPESGRPCFVAFKNENDTQPYIVSYFNHDYTRHDYARQSHAKTQIPKYWLYV